MAMENISERMEELTRANIGLIKSTDKVYISGKMEESITEDEKTGNSTEKESINLLMGKRGKECGKTVEG